MLNETQPLAQPVSKPISIEPVLDEMPRSQVACAWIGSGTTDDPYRPQFADDYPAESWSDVSGASAEEIAKGVVGCLVEGVWQAKTLGAVKADVAYAVTVDAGVLADAPEDALAVLGLARVETKSG